MSIENWLIGLCGALCGVYVGHLLTVRLFKERVKLQKNAFWGEFEIIKESFCLHLPALIDDYETPLKNHYSGVPEIDMTLIDCLNVELAASTEILNVDQRHLTIRLRSLNKKLQDLSIKRDVHIKEWFENGNQLSEQKKQSTKQSVQFYTAQLLLDAIQIVFYTCKLTEDKQKFSFGTYSMLNHAEVACRICNIDFKRDFWEKVERRLRRPM